MIEAGRILQNRYRIDRKIGQGGMGAVYVATDEKFGSTVAIKETFFSDEKFGKAFQREARLLNNLRHAALPKVSDHFDDENGQFLVMEYIPGDDLSAMMEVRGSAFPAKDVAQWADQLLDALEYLHAQDIIHRDIKPQNLKLTPRGQIILLDFGLAKGNPSDAAHQTAAKSVFGFSRNYASLEQMQGTGTDPRSDLYSLGATLYHLATGTPPEDALARAMDVLSSKADPLKAPNEINPQVPARISDVLMKAMDLNAGNRPISAAAMREMLKGDYENAENGQTALAGGAIFTQNTELQPKNTALDTGSNLSETENETALRTAAASGAAGFQVEIHGDSKPAGFAAPPPNRSGKKALWAGAGLSGLLLIGAAGAGAYFVKPSLFGNAAKKEDAAANKPIEPKKESLPGGAIANSATAGAIANLEGDSNIEKSSNIAIKDHPELAPAPKPGHPDPKAPLPEAVPPKELAKEAPKEAPKAPKPLSPPKTNEVVIDDGDTKIYKDGRIESPDGTIMPNGTIIAKEDGKTIVVNPGRRIPTKEELMRMTPKQRQRMKRAFEGLSQEEKDRIKAELERRKAAQSPANPPPVPPRP